jgi:hypothetical protein
MKNIKQNAIKTIFKLPFFVNLITVIFWGYRYIWFSKETIPAERVLIGLIMLLASLLLFPVADNICNKKEQ